MKKQKLKNYEELTEAEKERMIRAIFYFSLEYPFKEFKMRLWEFYSTWVCNAAQVAEPADHENNMLFYGSLVGLFKAFEKSRRKLPTT